MTKPPEPVVTGELKVTQADRDAAATWFTEYAGKTLEAECMREGTADHWPLVKVFARHRTANALPGDVGIFDDADVHACCTEALLRHRGCEVPKDRDWSAVQFGEIAASDVRAILAALTPSALPGDVGESGEALAEELRRAFPAGGKLGVRLSGHMFARILAALPSHKGEKS